MSIRFIAIVLMVNASLLMSAQGYFSISPNTVVNIGSHLLLNNISLINEGSLHGDSTSLLTMSSTGTKQYVIRTSYPAMMNLNKLSIKGNIMTGYQDTISAEEVILGGKFIVGGVLQVRSGNLVGETKDHYCRTGEGACIIAPDIALVSGQSKNVLGLNLTSANNTTTTIIRQHAPVNRIERGSVTSSSVNRVYTFVDPLILSGVDFWLCADELSTSGMASLAYLTPFNWEFFPKTYLLSTENNTYKASNLIGLGSINGISAFGFSGLYASEFITPNGDGKNDYLSFSGLEFIDKPCLVIIDPRGNVLSKIDSYSNDFNGDGFPSGPYYYILYSDGKPLKRGYVEIIK